jgi:DNA-binding NarL/FixJ family response regulator
VSRSNESVDRPVGAELEAVEEAAGARLRAETEADANAAGVAAEALLAAATSAMAAGYPLGDIAQAETRGKARLRDELRDDALKLVERSGRSMRDAMVDHHQAIARAVRLGLSMREIALAAGVTHGTIRAISNRLVGKEPAGDVAEHELPDSTSGEGLDTSEQPSLTKPR